MLFIFKIPDRELLFEINTHQKDLAIMLIDSVNTHKSNMTFDIDGKSGRVLWKIKDELYTQYYYPPNLRNLEFPPHSLISEMFA